MFASSGLVVWCQAGYTYLQIVFFRCKEGVDFMQPGADRVLKLGPRSICNQKFYVHTYSPMSAIEVPVEMFLSCICHIKYVMQTLALG